MIPGCCGGVRGQCLMRVTLVDPEDARDGTGLRVKEDLSRMPKSSRKEGAWLGGLETVEQR